MDIFKTLLLNNPTSFGGQVTYQGTWDASANTPTLVSGSGVKGSYYVVSVNGSTNLDGVTDWKVGDWAIFNGSAWQKVDNTDQVSSVFGRQGAVVGVSTDYSAVGITNTAIGASNPSTGGFTSITGNSLTAPATTDLVLQGGSTGASLTLGQGASGAITLAPTGSGLVNLTPAAGQDMALKIHSNLYGSSIWFTPTNSPNATFRWVLGAALTAGKFHFTNDSLGTVFEMSYPAGNAKFYSTTDATSTSSGSVQTLGGLGVAKSLYVGGTSNLPVIDVSNYITLTNGNQYKLTPSATTLTLTNNSSGQGIWTFTNSTATLSVPSVTDSTSVSTGALTTAGGIGAAKAIYAGSDSYFNGVRVGRGAGNDASNTALGYNALYSNTTATDNTAVGNGALATTSTGYANTAVGTGALQQNTTGICNVAIGQHSLFVATTASNNVGIGQDSLRKCTTGGSNLAIGTAALYNLIDGGTNTGISKGALYSITSGSNNVGIGFNNLSATTTGNYNSAVGHYALLSNITGSNNVALGYYAGAYETGSNAFYVDTFNRSTTAGDKAGAILYGVMNATPASQTLTINAATTISSTTASTSSTTGALIVSGGIGVASDSWINGIRVGKGANSLDNVAIGTATMGSITTGSSNIAIGWGGQNNVTTGGANTSIGRSALSALTTGNNNVAVGSFALSTVTTASDNVAVGTNALKVNTSGTYNAAIGGSSLTANTTGYNNTAVGFFSLYANTTGSENVAIGRWALVSNTTANNLTAVGNLALQSNTTGGTNTAVGYSSLNANTTGGTNVAVGSFANNYNTIGSNNTSVGPYANQYSTTGVATFGAITGGSGYTDGTYTNVALTYVSGSTALSYPKVDITVSGGVVTAISLTTTGNLRDVAGIGFKDTTTVMSCASIGAGTGFAISPATLKTGDANTAIGSNCNANCAFGINNVAIGYRAMLGGVNTVNPSNNIAIGFRVLESITTGNSNIALGAYAGFSVTTGSSNTAIGNNTFMQGTTAYGNTALGDQSLRNTTGNYNVGIGQNALNTNTSGSNNTAFGTSALQQNSTGSGNVALGYYAGTYETGDNAFYVNNRNLSNTATEKAGSLLYGTFNSTVANQTLTINAATTVSSTTDSSSTTTGGLIVSGGAGIGKSLMVGDMIELGKNTTYGIRLVAGGGPELRIQTTAGVATNLSAANLNSNDYIACNRIIFGGVSAAQVRQTTAGDGVAVLYNAATNGFGRICLGGLSTSFPAIKRNSAGIAFRLADDSADASITAAAITGSDTIKSTSATGGIGYATGAGGTVTQATSRTTGVTLNKVCGQITLVSAAGTTSWQSFTVTNSTVAATDTIRVAQASGTDLYQMFVTNIAAGSFQITFATTGGTTTEQPVFNFSVLKAVNA